MKQLIKAFLICCCGCWFQTLSAQETITAEQAVAEALEKNFGILLAKNEAEIAKLNNTLGNAGFLPNVSISASEILSNNSINQRFANGLVVVSDNVGSDNFNSSINLNWTIFDGLRMFATRKRLNEADFFGQTQLKAQVLQSVAEVLTAYYNAVKIKQQIKATEDVIKVGRERLNIAAQRFNLGSAAKTELLQAKIDLNILLGSLIRQQQLLGLAALELSLLIGKQEETQIMVTDSIPLPKPIDKEEVNRNLASVNPVYQSALSQIRTNEYMIKEARSFQYPTVTILSAYNLSRSSSEAGFALFNQNQGYNYGIMVNMPLFSGFNLQREKKVAKASLLTQKIIAEQTLAGLKNEVAAAFRSYRDAVEILNLELENQAFAKENIDIAMEQFRLGSINTVMLKEAQNAYELCAMRLAEARYDAKIAEITLLRLSGQLVK